MKQALPYLFAIITLPVLLGSCKGTRTVAMDSMRPAEITFPSYVNTLVIVDRSRFEKKAVNIIEGVLTGELPGEDEAGVQALVNSFRQQLTYSPRFQTKVATERLAGNSLTTAFPQQLSWSKVSSLCRKYGAQAVVAVEIFDTDFIITNGKRKVKKTIVVDSVKQQVEVDEYYAEGVGNIAIGIRLYDPKAKTIVDQQLIKRNNTWKVSGSTLQDALAQLIAKGDATRFLSQNVGSKYAYKVAPMPVRITRSFNGKSRKAPALEQGSRYADVGKWQEAIRIWKRGIANSPTKQGGYLSYNIAIAYEVIGDLEKAKQWAQKSYVQFGNKDAKGYVSLIRQRLYEEQLAERQLK